MTVPSQKDAWDSFYRAQPRPWKGVLRNRTPFPFGKGEIVLDIGCGNGKTSSALIEAGCDVTGMDISEDAVGICRRTHGNRMKVICASAGSIPLNDGSADGIVMVHVLEHLTDDEIGGAVKEAHRVLRPGGKVYVKVFHTDDMRSDIGERIDDRTVVRGNGIRYRYFTGTELKDMFSGFREISAERFDERTKFKGTRSWIEAVFERMA